MSAGPDASSGNGAAPPTDSDTPATMLGAVSPEPSAAPAAADPPAADQGPDAEPASPPRPKPGPKLCGVCGIQPSKYKCPRCSLPYCSVPCNKQHKENHPPDPPKADPPSTTNPPEPQPQDNDPYRILLEHTSAFDHLFAKYPALPAELARIQQTTVPPADNTSAPRFPFPGTGGNTNNPRNKQPQPWTRDVGLRRGADALRRARTNPGDVGDGVREFCELVLFLLGKQQERDKEGAVAKVRVAKVREEVMAEEAKVIERLLREEGG